MMEIERYCYWCVIAILWILNGRAFYNWYIAWCLAEYGEAEVKKRMSQMWLCYFIGPPLTMMSLLGLLGSPSKR